MMKNLLPGATNAGMFVPVEEQAFRALVVSRLANPSHARAACQMNRALTRAHLGVITFAACRGQTAVDHSVRTRIEREAWRCVERTIDTAHEAADPASDAKHHIERQVWHCIECPPRCRIVRGSHAALVWFHAEPEAVLLALTGADPPPLDVILHPLLIAPGLPGLYRAASAEEAALWTRLPTGDAPSRLIDRLLREGVVAVSD